MIDFCEIKARDLPGAVQDIIDDGYRLTAMFANDERAIKDCFAIYCIFIAAGSFKVVRTIVGHEDNGRFPSITPLTAAAAWYEREIHDLFGLIPVGHPDLRPLVLHENWPRGEYPLRKDFDLLKDIPVQKGDFDMGHGVEGSGVFEVPVGPIHAGIIEPGHFRFSQAGERIIKLEAKLFYTHRGIEKSMEGMNVEQGIFRAERICGACSVSHALSYSQAVEAAAGIKIGTRAAYIRVILAELERLYNHVGDIGNLCAGVGLAVIVSNGSRLKEQLMRLNERLTGNRFLRGVIVPGGVAKDITDGDIDTISAVLEPVCRELIELIDILKSNDEFLNRTDTTGILPTEAAVDLAVVGVAARASGINYDVRRDNPYAAYGELGFKVPVYTSGDVTARLFVRADEAVQSVNIIKEALEKLPSDKEPLSAKIPSITPYTTGFGWSESARGSNIHWLMMGENNTIYRYFVRSASYPNWPALSVAAPGDIIPDFPLINKSFELCYACIDR